MNETKFSCKHKGCTNLKHLSLGFCCKHYYQFKKHKRTFDFTCKDFNEIIDCGDHYELILLDRKMNENGRAKIDKEDLAKVKSVGRWYLDPKGYVYNSCTDTLMHRLVMNAKRGEEIDHENTGTKYKSDNRKSNLRQSTHQENLFNKGKYKTNTSGFKGVSRRKDGKWRATIYNSVKQIYLGAFNTPEEASAAYNEAAKLLHKNFIHKSLLVEVDAHSAKVKRLIRFNRKPQS